MAARGGRPLLLIDIAVPRDIDPAVRELEGVHLRDIDDLQRVVERNLSGREAEARRAEALLEHELERFQRWLGDARRRAHDRGAARARRGDRAPGAGREQRPLGVAQRGRPGAARADGRRRSSSACCTSRPCASRRAATSSGTYAYVQALRELFGLETEQLSAFEAATSGRARPQRTTRAGADVTPIRLARGARQKR